MFLFLQWPRAGLHLNTPCVPLPAWSSSGGQPPGGRGSRRRSQRSSRRPGLGQGRGLGGWVLRGRACRSLLQLVRPASLSAVFPCAHPQCTGCRRRRALGGGSRRRRHEQGRGAGGCRAGEDWQGERLCVYVMSGALASGKLRAKLVSPCHLPAAAAAAAGCAPGGRSHRGGGPPDQGVSRGQLKLCCAVRPCPTAVFKHTLSDMCRCTVLCCAVRCCCRYYGGEESEPTEPAKKRWWIF